jgi:succinoglycan biosynthesis transport protein ExoP
VDNELILAQRPQRGQRESSSGRGSADRSYTRLVSFEAIDDSAPASEDQSAVMDTLRLLRERWWVVVLITLFGGAVGAGMTLLQEPIYQAKLSLEIQPPAETPLGTRGAVAGESPVTNIQTEVKVLESLTLRRRVLDVLKRSHKLSTYTPPDRLAKWRKVFGIAPPNSGGDKLAIIPPFESKVRSFDGTDVVEILCDSPDPNFSANYANTTAEEFIQLNLESHWGSYQRTSDWLGRQLEGIKRKLEESERQLQVYGAEHGLQYTDGKISLQSDKLKQLQDELSKAQADRVARQSAFEVAMASSADAVPQVIDNARLSAYLSKLTELRRELADLSSIYTPEHYKVASVQAQVAEVETALRNESDAVLNKIRNEYQAANRREELLLTAYVAQEGVVSREGATAIHYDVLRRDVETNRQLYDSLLQRVKEGSVTSTLATNNMHILDSAEPPPEPYKPSIVSNLLKGVGSGLLLVVFAVIAADRINQNLRAPGDVAFHLGVPELGVIPSSESLPSPHSQVPKQSRAGLNGNRDESSQERVELISWQNSNSLLAESFRGTLASILLSANGSRPRVIMVTSAFRGEGKTTMVSNLGIGIGEINQRILLIDADMRKPRLHQIFELSNSWGLSDLLKERSMLRATPVEALARPTKVAGVWVLPSGPGAVSISNLLYSNRMAELLERLRNDFDMILIDTPPMLSIADARILGRLADAAVLVIRAGHTSRSDGQRAKERLIEDGIPVLGVILNRWDLKAKGRYGYEGYSSHAAPV